VIALVATLVAAGAAEPGLELLREGRAAEAAGSFAAALRNDPKNAALANDLGLALSRAGRPQEAERSYRLSIQLNPRRWHVYGNLADLLSASRDRWDRADEIVALLERGLSSLGPAARTRLSLRMAEFERSVGRTGQARQRLLALAPGMDGDQARKVRELLDRIADDDRARALEDWPEPAPAPAQIAALQEAERKLAADDPRGALATADALCAAQPAWRAAHRLRARVLESAGRLDEEARELRILTQLAPADGAAWRRLGQILTDHGGLLEADRADVALREALALEPSWIDLWLLRARVALRQGRAQDALRHLERYRRSGGHDAEVDRLASAATAQAGSEVTKPNAEAPPKREPTANARALHQQASGAESPEDARRLLEEALDDSPAFVEAAAALFSFGAPVPERTVEALRDDGSALLDLASRVRRAGGPAALVAPWIDRAVETGAAEARFARAQLRLEQGDRGGAVEDLVAYAATPDPQHLDEARLLRSQVIAPSRTDVALLQARRRLAEDRPEAALATVGERCEPDMDPARLLAIGQVREFSGELSRALECYRLAAPLPLALRRLARVAEREPDVRATDELRTAAAKGISEALWALARIDLAAGRQDAALANVESFLAAAAPDDPGLADARAARSAILRKTTEAAQARARYRGAVATAAFLAFAALAAWLWAGTTMKSALRRAPRLFPHLARAANEVRHDVIKHRAGALAMVGQARREDLVRALLFPEPASRVVARHYDELRAAARAQGVSLRRLSREPVFGPLVRDLARAETLLQGPGDDGKELAEIDARIRGEHARNLGQLLRLGPRTRLDASAVAGWIRDVEAEMRRGGSSWTAPSILMKGMEVEFPVERGALSTIFANLLRNAQAAAAGGEVIVRLGEERDAAGRNLTVLLVGDSGTHAISVEAIEQRESGRGLALVRDLAREWQGHVVVRAEEPPWKKAVGACFPAAPA
jgi:tetratricopeptide (TPR) repeat protein